MAAGMSATAMLAAGLALVIIVLVYCTPIMPTNSLPPLNKDVLSQRLSYALYGEEHNSSQEAMSSSVPITPLVLFTVFDNPQAPHLISNFSLVQVSYQRAVLTGAHPVVLTDRIDVLTEGRAAGMRVVDIGSLAAPEVYEFAAIYRHQSINPVVYERGCFWRWIVMNAYVESLLLAGEDVRMVASVDSDVYLLEPLETAIPPRFRRLWAHQELLVMTPGAVVVMSPKGLREFSNVVVSLYRSPDLLAHVIREAAHIMSMDNIYNACEKGESVVVNCFNSTAHGGGRVNYQFDDMRLLLHFVGAATRVPATAGIGGRFAYNSGQSRTVHFEEQMSCVPQHWSSYLDGKTGVLLTRSDTTPDTSAPRARVFVPDDGLPACYVHFQGGKDLKKRFWLLHSWLNVGRPGDTYQFWT